MSETKPTRLSLSERLRRRIRSAGAISFRDWMEAALYDVEAGYYVRSDLERWGRGGDYRTAPERSPLFAATFGGFFSTLYDELDAPPEWTIFESGAGAGYFAFSVLQTLQRDYPHVLSATRYVIDERSDDAVERVSNRLTEFADRVAFRRLAENGAAHDVGIVFANELLDAFPVHRVISHDGKLFELFVTLDDENRFVWTDHEPSTPRLAEYLLCSGVKLLDGQIAEINLEVEGWLNRSASIFKRGYVIIVDYGAEVSDLYRAPHRSKGTLRSFRQHLLTDDVLAKPGEQDLTATIDWSNIRRVGEAIGLKTVSFERQDEFLLRAGILDRLERMTSEASTEVEALILRSSVRELILPGGMSESFQVLVLRQET